MKPTTVATSQGWAWYPCGWKLFMASPGTQLIYLAAFVIIAIVLGLIPFLGPLALALGSPLLVAGWYHALRLLERGEPIEPATLFAAFADPRKRGPLVALGVVMLAAEVLAVLLSWVLLGGAVLSLHQLQPGYVPATLGPGLLVWLLLVLVLATALFMTLFYAIPLVMFRDMGPFPAMRSSFDAGLSNFMALLLFGVIYAVLAFVAMIPMGLGLVLLVPVSVGAAYCSYRSVFGDAAQEPGTKATGSQ